MVSHRRTVVWRDSRLRLSNSNDFCASMTSSSILRSSVTGASFNILVLTTSSSVGAKLFFKYPESGEHSTGHSGPIFPEPEIRENVVSPVVFGRMKKVCNQAPINRGVKSKEQGGESQAFVRALLCDCVNPIVGGGYERVHFAHLAHLQRGSVIRLGWTVRLSELIFRFRGQPVDPTHNAGTSRTPNRGVYSLPQFAQSKS